MLMNDSLERKFIFLSLLYKNCGSQHFIYVVVDSEGKNTGALRRLQFIG